MTRVAVLGAGFQGVSAALELALRGVDVDLYDRHDACITQAGGRNEGKIHLGFVYAKDASLDTTRLLVEGALTFAGALRRWLECDLAEADLSTPHCYAVHRDSMLTPAAVLDHFARVRDIAREVGCGGSRTYLGRHPGSIGFDLDEEEPGQVFDSDEIVAVIRTDERSVDVIRLAERLRARVADEPRITFYPGTEITAAARDGGAIGVSLACDGVALNRRYRHVVNCLWEGKLAVDRGMQCMPGYPSLYRLKYGINLGVRQSADPLPSTTFVVGPFGDIVQFADRLYLSWYPVACRARSKAITPPAWPRELSGDQGRHMIEQTFDAFARLVTPMRDLHAGLFPEAYVSGGIILAAGETDIDDPQSRLHTRSAVGVRSFDGYHSVDTGKYTLAPMFAIEVADRVCGSR